MSLQSILKVQFTGTKVKKIKIKNRFYVYECIALRFRNEERRESILYVTTLRSLSDPTRCKDIKFYNVLPRRSHRIACTPFSLTRERATEDGHNFSLPNLKLFVVEQSSPECDHWFVPSVPKAEQAWTSWQPPCLILRFVEFYSMKASASRLGNWLSHYDFGYNPAIAMHSEFVC